MTAKGDRPGHVGIRRLGARLRPGTGGAMVGGFLSWWGRALASWLPLRLRRVLGFDRGRLLLQADDEAVQLRLQQGGELRDLGRVPLQADVLPEHDVGHGVDRGLDTSARPGIAPANRSDPLAALLTARIAELPRWLLLPAASGLRRRMTLPAAAADRLRDVVGFEIDRQTPFSAEAVAFDARVLGRHGGDGQLDVELVAVPRHALDRQLAALGGLSATLAGIDVTGGDGVPLGVNLLPPRQRSRRADPWKRWNWALAGVATLAVVALLWQLLDNRRAVADVFEQRIAADAQAGRRAAAQRQQLVNLIQGQRFLDQARAARPTTVEVIDELTRRLPDNTYLEKLSIDDERLMVIGLSSEAPVLIGRLQDAQLWSAPALAGALQPDPSSGRDRFTLVAQLAPTQADSAASEPESARDR